MADVDVDIVGESSLRITENGAEKERTYKVKNLTASTPSALEWEALDHVPAMGSPHESIPINGLLVRELQPVAESGSMVTVTVMYRTPEFSGGGANVPEEGDPPRIEIGGRVTRSRTNVDRNGNLLTVSYSGDDDFDAIPENVATVDLAVPQFTVSYTRRETQSPDSKARRFVGHVNSTTFAGQGPGKWLCEAIIGRSDDGEQSYLVTHEFGFREGDNGNGWAAHVFAKDSETGQIPSGVTVGDGEEFYEVYPEDDFNDLAL